MRKKKTYKFIIPMLSPIYKFNQLPNGDGDAEISVVENRFLWGYDIKAVIWCDNCLNVDENYVEK